jgi:hypothetical protein
LVPIGELGADEDWDASRLITGGNPHVFRPYGVNGDVDREEEEEGGAEKEEKPPGLVLPPTTQELSQGDKIHDHVHACDVRVMQPRSEIR